MAYFILLFSPLWFHIHVIKDSYISFSYRSNYYPIYYSLLSMKCQPLECSLCVFQASVNWLFWGPLPTAPSSLCLSLTILIRVPSWGLFLIPTEPCAHCSALICWLQVFGCFNSCVAAAHDPSKLQPIKGMDFRSSVRCPEEYKPAAGGRVFREPVKYHRKEKGMILLFGKRRNDGWDHLCCLFFFKFLKINLFGVNCFF